MGNNFLLANFRSTRFFACRFHFAIFAIALGFGATTFAQQAPAHAASTQPGSAQKKTFEFDAAQTTVTYTLGATMHTVHGTFKLKHGSIKFDEATGQSSGELTVDATTGDSGNQGRDSKMNKDILESRKYPEIIFTPQRFKGNLAGTGESHLEVEGQFMIHGQAHPMTLMIDADLSGKADATADTEFDVPYQKWGMKNPSTFILRVDDKVQIHIHAVAKQVAAQQASSH